MIACDPAHNGQSRPEVAFATPAKMKRFSLFPVQRWLSPGATAVVGSCPGQRPLCSSHVGTLGVCTGVGMWPQLQMGDLAPLLTQVAG